MLKWFISDIMNDVEIIYINSLVLCFILQCSWFVLVSLLRFPSLNHKLLSFRFILYLFFWDYGL